MSFLAVAWAESAPVKDVYERAIITMMAHRANSDGTEAYPTISKLADYACCDATTIKRRLTAMRTRGLIAYGNQKKVKHLPPDKRPRVYDLMIPFSWYSAAQLEDVDRDRAGRGLKPLVEAMRPDLKKPAGPGRKTRTDVGVPRPHRRKKTEAEGTDLGGAEAAGEDAPTVEDASGETPDEEAGSPRSEGDSSEAGVLIDPPLDGAGDTPAEGDGGAISTPAGVLIDTSRGCYKHPNTVHPPTVGNSPSCQSPGGRAAAPQTPAGKKPGSPQSVVTDQLELVGDPPHAYAGTPAREATPEGTTTRPATGYELHGTGALLHALEQAAAAVRQEPGKAAFDAASRLAFLRLECRHRGIAVERVQAAEAGHAEPLLDVDEEDLVLAGGGADESRPSRRRSRR